MVTSIENENRGLSEQEAALLLVKKGLEKLREKIAPRQKIVKYGNGQGLLGLSLTNNKKIRLLEEGPRLIKEVIGLVVDKNNNLSIWNKRCGKQSLELMEIINPIVWEENYRRGEEKLKQIEQKKLKKPDFNFYLSMARREFPQAPARMGAEVLIGERKTELFLASERVDFGRKGDMKERVFIENLCSVEGVQKFTQILTDFYVGLKTGEGK